MTTSNSSPPIGSAEWLEDLRGRSEQLQESIANSVVTTSSRDGAVTVTIGPNGALHDLGLGHRAADHTPTQLTALIMGTVRKAQRQAAARVSEAFGPFGSPDLTEQTRKFLAYLPPEDEPDGAATDGQDDMFVPEGLVDQEVHRPAPAPLPMPPARDRARRRPADDDTDDEMKPW